MNSFSMEMARIDQLRAERDEARALARRYYRLYRSAARCAQLYIGLYIQALDAQGGRDREEEK